MILKKTKQLKLQHLCWNAVKKCFIRLHFFFKKDLFKSKSLSRIQIAAESILWTVQFKIKKVLCKKFVAQQLMATSSNHGWEQNKSHRSLWTTPERFALPSHFPLIYSILSLLLDPNHSFPMRSFTADWPNSWQVLRWWFSFLLLHIIIVIIIPALLNYGSHFFLIFTPVFPVQLCSFIVGWTIWVGVM